MRKSALFSFHRAGHLGRWLEVFFYFYGNLAKEVLSSCHASLPAAAAALARDPTPFAPQR
jgi:hypothetical protein